MRIDDKESGHNHDLIFLHLHLTGFNNTVNFFSLLKAWKVPCQETWRVCQFVSTSTAPSGPFHRRRSESLIVHMMNTRAVHQAFVCTTCCCLYRLCETKEARWRGAVDLCVVALCAGCYQEIRMAKLFIGNHGEKVLPVAMKSTEEWSEEPYATHCWAEILLQNVKIYWGIVPLLKCIELHSYTVRYDIFHTIQRGAGKKKNVRKVNHESTQISRVSGVVMFSALEIAACRGMKLLSCCWVVHIIRSISFQLFCLQKCTVIFHQQG